MATSKISKGMLMQFEKETSIIRTLSFCQITVKFIYLFIKFSVIAKFPSSILQLTNYLGFVGARATFELLVD